MKALILLPFMTTFLSAKERPNILFIFSDDQSIELSVAIQMPMTG